MSAAPTVSAAYRRIAVLRLSSLGDVILTLPVVHALRRGFPQARLEYWTKEEYRDVLAFDPAIDHVRVLEKDASRVEDLVSMSAELEDNDLIVDLHGNSRTRVLRFRQKSRQLVAPSDRMLRWRWVHARWTQPGPAPRATDRYARAIEPLGIAPAGPPHVAAGEEAEAWARGFLASWHPAAADLSPSSDPSWVKQRPPIAMIPAARHATKQWIESHWLVLHDRLAAAGHPLLYFSLERERRSFPALSSRVDQDPRAQWCTERLPRMAALLSHARAAVTVDTGLMHLAAARGVPVVAMFGSTAPELGFTPAGEGHVVLCRHEPCQPCTLHGREHCPQGHFRCMKLLEPSQVIDALRGMGIPVD